MLKSERLNKELWLEINLMPNERYEVSVWTNSEEIYMAGEICSVEEAIESVEYDDFETALEEYNKIVEEYKNGKV